MTSSSFNFTASNSSSADRRFAAASSSSSSLLSSSAPGSARLFTRLTALSARSPSTILNDNNSRLTLLKRETSSENDGNNNPDDDASKLYTDFGSGFNRRYSNDDIGVIASVGKRSSSAKLQFSRNAASLTTTITQPCLYYCCECDAKFEKEESLKRHVASTRHGTKNAVTLSNSSVVDSKAVYECDASGCQRHYTSYSSFIKHKKSHCDAIGPVSCVSPTAEVGSSSCVVKTPSRHVGEKKFQCSQCSKRFPTSKDLKRHDVVHTGNREFQCSFCSHRFGRKDHRMRHEKKAHASELSPSVQQHQQPPKFQPLIQTQPNSFLFDRQTSSSSSPTPLLPSSTGSTALSPGSRSAVTPPPAMLLHSGTPEQLVVQRQPQWYRRPSQSPPLSSPPQPSNTNDDSTNGGIKYEPFSMEDEVDTLSPLMDEDSNSMAADQKPEVVDLQQLFHSDNSDDAIIAAASCDAGRLGVVETCSRSVPLDEMTLTSEEGDDAAGSDDVKAETFDWMIPDFLADEDPPKTAIVDPASLYEPTHPPNDVIIKSEQCSIIAAPSYGGRHARMGVPIEAQQHQQQPPPAPPLIKVPATSIVGPAAVMAKEPEIIFGDYMTRTKNPVLPSVYVDNSHQQQPTRCGGGNNVVDATTTPTVTVVAATAAVSAAAAPVDTSKSFSSFRQRSSSSLLFEEEEDDFMADVDVYLRDRDIFSNI